MPRDILNDYGPNSPANQKARATNGGQMPVRDVMGYCPPQGPTNITDAKTPGLHGGNHGIANCFYPDADDSGGSVGLHGDNQSNKGSQR